MKMTREIWKDVKDFYGLYQISNLGNVKSLGRKVAGGKFIQREKMMKIKVEPNGYKSFTGVDWKGKRKTLYIHRLIAEAFVFNPNPNEFDVVNHIDGNKLNNSIDNLEWCTRAYNMKHAWNTGLMEGVSKTNKGQSNGNTKLTEDNVREIRRLYALDKKQYSYKKLAETYGVKSEAIGQIVRKETWKHVE